MKRYILEIEETDEAEIHMRSHGDGFSPAELVGFLYWQISNITDQLKSEIKPDVKID